MTRKWWQSENDKNKTPEWHPVDIACPLCGTRHVGDVSKRIVIVRYQAHCDKCNTDIAAERKRPLPNGDDYGAYGTERGEDYDNIPF